MSPGFPEWNSKEVSEASINIVGTYTSLVRDLYMSAARCGRRMDASCQKCTTGLAEAKAKAQLAQAGH